MYRLLCCLFVCLTFATEELDDQSRGNRQFPFMSPPFPPPLPFSPLRNARQFLHDRIQARLQSHFDQPVSPIGQSLQNRIHDRMQNRGDTLRNVTQAAKGCFTNEHGYKCCSQKLFTFMGGAFQNPVVAQILHRVEGRLQHVVEKLIEMVQKHFGVSFEIVAASRDFASKNTFLSDLMCKTKTPTGKTVLIYATPVPYSTEPGVLRRLSQQEIRAKGWGERFLQISELSFMANRTRRFLG